MHVPCRSSRRVLAGARPWRAGASSLLHAGAGGWRVVVGAHSERAGVCVCEGQAVAMLLAVCVRGVGGFVLRRLARP
jgi:hypothetical protein